MKQPEPALMGHSERNITRDALKTWPPKLLAQKNQFFLNNTTETGFCDEAIKSRNFVAMFSQYPNLSSVSFPKTRRTTDRATFSGVFGDFCRLCPTALTVPGSARSLLCLHLIWFGVSAFGQSVPDFWFWPEMFTLFHP